VTVPPAHTTDDATGWAVMLTGVLTTTALVERAEQPAAVVTRTV